MSVKSSHNLKNIPQLVDLNAGSKNFELTFTVRTQNGEPFHAVVVDQKTLDSSQYNYKLVNEGQISGTVINDKNVQDNFYLVLKADTPCVCTVEVNKREIPPKMESLPVASVASYTWTQILTYTGIAIAIGLALYWIYYRKKSEGENDDESSEMSARSEKSKSEKSKSSHVSERKNPPNNRVSQPLLERLKKLPVDE